jgi:hypothetical protein
MTIGKKLYTSFSVAVGIALIACGMGIFNVGKLGDALTTMTTRTAKCLYLVGMIDNYSSDALAQVRGELLMAHLHNADGVEAAYKAAMDDLDLIKKDNDEFIATTTSPEIGERAASRAKDRASAQSCHIDPHAAFEGRPDRSRSVVAGRRGSHGGDLQFGRR